MQLPRPIFWFRVFLVAIGLPAAVFLYFLYNHIIGLDFDLLGAVARQWAIAYVVIAALLAVCVLVSLVVLILPPRPWTYFVALASLLLWSGLLITLPLTIALAIGMLRKSARDYYYTGGLVNGAPVGSHWYPFTLPSWLAWIDYYYPFTISGTLLFAISFYLLGVAFGGEGNLYALIFCLLGFASLFVLVLVGRLQALANSDPDIHWDTGRPLIARLHATNQRLILADMRVAFYYRFHFSLAARLDVGRGASLYINREGASAKDGELLVPMFLPLAGRMDAQGRLMIKDVFGLTRARIGPVLKQQFVVVPPIFPGKQLVRFRNSASLESTRKLQNADDEKYYMREYIAGDRLKDINWKASFKFFELITRISPKSPEESRLLHVEFRNFHPSELDTVSSIMHLNYLKSWLISFLTTVKRDHPDLQFQVFTADDIFDLETEQDIAVFSRDLALMQYQRGSHFRQPLPPVAEKFIFTTPYDGGLSHSAAGRGQMTIHLFRTAIDNSRDARNVRVFPGEELNPYPGTWVLRKDTIGRKRATAAGLPGNVMEERLRVRLL